ncbi:aspartate protease, putative [Bodo saltans]|uniref:Aspartate protease, putative n=1 Tax=Bodo saltans TaxID=75058 RepID=A0A0S4KGW0_BODSA|nr:aspartate protease, putative [Bodo saltans]|eukprot:CUI14930.1 aspartate protease, putative [Bodo saltans]
MQLLCHITNASNNRHDVTLSDIDASDPLALVCALLEDSAGIEAADQRVTSTLANGGGELLLPHRSLKEQGVQGTMVELNVYHKDVYAQQRSNGAQTPAPTNTSASTGAAVASQDDAARLIAQLFAGGGGQQPQPQQQQQQPSPDELIARLFQGGAASAASAAPTHNAAAAAPIPPDPEDPEYQRRLYEHIQRQNLEENLANAMEYTPEAFARVVMLYVPCTVNNVPLTAFVDSGAQMSVMSERMAEKCGIMRLLDRRMQGVAKGVGTCRILGRVHMTMVSLGGLVLPFSITVLERQDMDFLIGLDQLKRHQMQIDLKANCLRIDEHALPFLSEGELPIHLRKESAGENEEEEGEQQQQQTAESHAATKAKEEAQSHSAAAAIARNSAAPDAAKASKVATPPSQTQTASFFFLKTKKKRESSSSNRQQSRMQLRRQKKKRSLTLLLRPSPEIQQQHPMLHERKLPRPHPKHRQLQHRHRLLLLSQRRLLQLLSTKKRWLGFKK